MAKTKGPGGNAAKANQPVKLGVNTTAKSAAASSAVKRPAPESSSSEDSDDNGAPKLFNAAKKPAAATPGQKGDTPAKGGAAAAVNGGQQGPEEEMNGVAEPDVQPESESTPKNNFRAPQEKRRSSPFRRVKEVAPVDVQGGDYRLSDNSYNAFRDGMGDADWADKAAKDFSTVKGKNFRHEKTKKKRGSYKGGKITTAVNSIKFT